MAKPQINVAIDFSNHCRESTKVAQQLLGKHGELHTRWRPLELRFLDLSNATNPANTANATNSTFLS